ncbi:hypothetical protein AVEN_65230-1 [Araneus ventricosus]|uniref:Uncharacterized protein n=1 Tax=Araneus ventricosus TaxID=182803 RepID=A0A4Y2AHE5_ARAVE|nr:hypothetical protein AVEN_65230-1 [Araneus ventricosus]
MTPKRIVSHYKTFITHQRESVALIYLTLSNPHAWLKALFPRRLDCTWRVVPTAIYKPLMSEHLFTSHRIVQTIQSTNESLRSKAAKYDKLQTRLAKPHVVGSRTCNPPIPMSSL